jgi:hypothetical protein
LRCPEHMDRRVQRITHAAGDRKLASSRSDLEPASAWDDGLQCGQFRLKERLVQVIPSVIVFPGLFEMVNNFFIHWGT